MAGYSAELQRQHNPGVAILKEVLKTVKLDESLIRENNRILHEFLPSFIGAMKKEDALFRMLYQELYFTGSFYSDLRIDRPDEFDILVILKLPSSFVFNVEFHSQVLSFATCELQNKGLAEMHCPQLYRDLFENGYLISDKVRSWMQGVVDKATSIDQFPDKIYKITKTASGPARTLHLWKSDGGGIIDIDLVPVIRHDFKNHQLDIDSRARSKLDYNLKAFIVPKPYSHPVQPPVNSRVIRQLFRIHFPDAENALIHDIGCVKPIIKLLKLLRDKEDWKSLASYYLKTVVMGMLLENSGREHWKEDNMDDRFIAALTELKRCLELKKIPFFFSKKNNLIAKMNSHEATIISNRLNYIVIDVQRNRRELWKYFKLSPAF